MKICVVGAGAIGGLLAIKLAQSGNDVTVIARGPNLKAIQDHGFKLITEDGGESITQLRALGSMSQAGPQDLVILGMKAHQVAAIVQELPAMYHDETMVLTAQNGIPWWYFFKHGGEYDGRTLESVDPGGVIAKNLPIERVVGTVVYPAAEMIQPGVLKHIEGNRFSVSEIDNSATPRIELLSKTLKDAGFKAPVISDIRSELWTKLWGNLSLNPISALTHATLVDICEFPLSRDLVAKMMKEAQDVGEKLGIGFRVSLEKRIAGAQAVGAHKTSMLQDVESGRAIEKDALIGSVIELGRMVNLPTPHIDAVFACISLLSKSLADQKGQLKITPY
ncbi:MAG: 2-dehydropantoate 2-reductase [Betaproteobacteria bacterium]